MKFNIRWDLAAIITGIALLISGLVYVVTLHNKINELERNKADISTTADLKAQMNNKADNLLLGELKAKVDAIDDKKLDEKIEKALQKIDEAEKNIIDQLPVGTIIASVLEPKIFLSEGRNKKWHLADDSGIPIGSAYSKLVTNANIHSKERLPDLRGVFLRGLNSSRVDGKGDINGNRLAGSYQSYSTALPEKSFIGVTDVKGQHQHDYDKARPYDAGAGGHGRAKPSGENKKTAPSGNHNHSVKINGGGDHETRPKNVAVYFYIKIN